MSPSDINDRAAPRPPHHGSAGAPPAPPPPTRDPAQEFLNKSRQGFANDHAGAFAVAYALLTLTDAINRVGNILENKETTNV